MRSPSLTSEQSIRNIKWVLMLLVGPLGLMGRELAGETSEANLNPSWDATVYPVLGISSFCGISSLRNI